MDVMMDLVMSSMIADTITYQPLSWYSSLYQELTHLEQPQAY
jgi:hypothetical protein